MRTKKKENDSLTVVGHLSEFRKHLLYSVLVFLAVSIVSFNYSEAIVTNLINKAKNTQFVYLSPAELFSSYIRLSLVMGLVVSLPYLLYRVWLFLRPGLYDTEKKAIRNSLALGLVLFLIGMVFAYEIVLPMSLRFFEGFQMPGVQSAVGFANYFSYVMNLVFAFGIVFELPIVVVLLTSLGVVKSDFLARHRKYVLLIVLIVAAVITPPDIVSQILLAIPMMLLFELGIRLGRNIERRKERKRALAEAEEAAEEAIAEPEKTAEEPAAKTETDEAMGEPPSEEKSPIRRKKTAEEIAKEIQEERKQK